MNKEAPKKVVIKISPDGSVEIAHKDEGVTVFLQYPDDAEVEVTEKGKKIWEKKGDS